MSLRSVATWRALLLTALTLIAHLASWPSRLLASTILTNADPVALAAAIQQGGTVKLGFDGIVPLTKALSVVSDTVVDATGHYVRLDGGGAVRHFVVNTGVTLILSNLTLVYGRFIGSNAEPNQPGSPAQGGSIYCSGGSLKLVHCTFYGNVVLGGTGGWPLTLETSGASGLGGAVYMTNGTLRVENCSFLSNRSAGGQGRSPTIYTAPGAPAFGGAVYVVASTSTFVGTTFATNSVQGGELWGGRPLGAGGSSFGAALADAEGTTAIEGCQFVGNEAQATGAVYSSGPDTGSANGGAISHQGGSASIRESVFRANHALGAWGTDRQTYAISSRGNGGAIYGLL